METKVDHNSFLRVITFTCFDSCVNSAVLVFDVLGETQEMDEGSGVSMSTLGNTCKIKTLIILLSYIIKIKKQLNFWQIRTLTLLMVSAFTHLRDPNYSRKPFWRCFPLHTGCKLNIQ